MLLTSCVTSVDLAIKEYNNLKELDRQLCLVSSNCLLRAFRITSLLSLCFLLLHKHTEYFGAEPMHSGDEHLDEESDEEREKDEIQTVLSNSDSSPK